MVSGKEIEVLEEISMHKRKILTNVNPIFWFCRIFLTRNSLLSSRIQFASVERPND